MTSAMTEIDRKIQCDLDQIFDACDQNRSNYIERQEFQDLCNDLSLTPKEFEHIFTELDNDEDGRIGREDFEKGFNSVVTLFTKRSTALGSSSTLSKASSLPRLASLKFSSSSVETYVNNIEITRVETSLKSKSAVEAKRLKERKRSIRKEKGMFAHQRHLSIQVAEPPDYVKEYYEEEAAAEEAKRTARAAAENKQTISGSEASKKQRPLVRQRSKSLESLSRGTGRSGRKGSLSWRREVEKSAVILWEKFLNDLDLGYYLLSTKSQEHVCDLYQKLHNVDEPQVLTQFENVVLSIIKDIRQQQCENERLERSYKREKDFHGKHLRQLEEEMEVQIQKAENRAKRLEKERLEHQKEEMKQKFQEEITTLQTNLTRMQKADMSSQRQTMTEEMKQRLDVLMQENRQLKSQLTDAETNLAITKSEVVTLKHDLDEKAEELDSDKSTLVEYISEHEQLTRQIHLLQEANKKLHDTNDSMRQVFETNRTSYKRQHSGHHSNPAVVVLSPYQQMSPAHSHPHAHRTAPLRRGSVVGDYIHSGPHTHQENGGHAMGPQNGSLMDELNHHRYNLDNRMLPEQDSCEVDSLPEEMDSGHSTLRDIPDIESEYEPNSVDEDGQCSTASSRRRARLNRRRLQAGMRRLEHETTTESELFESQDDVEEDFVDGFSASDLARETNFHHQQSSSCYDDEEPASDLDGVMRPKSSCSCGSRSSQGSHRSRRSVGGGMNGSRESVQQVIHPIQGGNVLRILPSQTVSPMKTITKEPEHVYKIILVGDAAVGKSSFIMRLCRDKFVTNMSSTLGMDLQTKTMEVDGRVIALQLWDTAGQERFRAIAKNYFRRTDGVLLLYDVAYERSFLNIRDWLDAIEEGSGSKTPPVMIVGNKSDKRDDPDYASKNFVSTEDGKRLAKDVDGLFIETSAKSGDNINEAITELTRVLRTNEDLEVQSANITLQEISKNGGKNKMAASCCA